MMILMRLLTVCTCVAISLAQSVDAHDLEHNCPPIHQPDVKNLTLKIATLEIPPVETFYYCYFFDLSEIIDTEKEYHFIATKPVIGNEVFTHHVLYAACDEDFQLPVNNEQECDSNIHQHCSKITGLWQPGISYNCLDPSSGWPVGKNGMKKMVLQIHYNNPSQLKHETDDTGVVLYYTEKLRPHPLNVFTVGSRIFTIPPKRSDYRVYATCTANCTKHFLKGPIKIETIIFHTHHRGIRVHLEIQRHDQSIEVYGKSSLKEQTLILPLKKHVTIFPSDTVSVACHYNTTNDAKIVSYGKGSTDEMCYAFIKVYPANNIRFGVCVNGVTCPIESNVKPSK